MLSLASVVFIIAGLLVLISLTQPAAERLRLPYTVVLAAVGVAIGGIASFLLYTPLTDSFNEIVGPLVNLPFSAEVFLVVFLPLLLFHAALTIDVREMAVDAAPVLTLAIVAVFVAAAGIGFALHWAGGVPLVAALLLGSIVATTDPAAVVGIFRDLGAPPRLVRLVEGESLLNDAAAILLFTVLLEMLTDGTRPNIAASVSGFAEDFLGGILLGFVAGRIFGAIIPWLGSSRLAEVTLALAVPYLTYLVGEHVFAVSGVIAVVSAGLTVGVVGRARLAPDNWRYLEQAWEQIGFWAGSLIFVTASILVPKLLVGIDLRYLWLLVVLTVAALLTRAAVLFALLPVLSVLRLSQRVNNAYKLAITWGGLRGAVTLALALAVTENSRIDPETQRFIAVLATGFVLVTLLVNGLTLRPIVRLLKLDRLSPVNEALRDKIAALVLREVSGAVKATADAYQIAPEVASTATTEYEPRIDGGMEGAAFEEAISDRERVTIGLVALANREHRLVLDHHAQHTVSGPAIERLLRNTTRILDGAKADGRLGYNRAARRLLAFQRSFRIAHFLHRHFGIDRPLQRQISTRFESLLIRRLALEELGRFNRQRLQPLLGQRVAAILDEVLAGRVADIARAIEALRLQYPEHAEALERHFLRQTGLRLELSLFRELLEEGLIGRELFDALGRERLAERRRATEEHPLDLGLRTEELITRFDMFRTLGAAELKALARLFRPRLALPGEKIIRKGDRGSQVFFISSGAVEVKLPHQTVRLGRGDFFGEMALLARRRRQADVIALGYCQMLVLNTADFRRFLRSHGTARAEIERTVEARNRMNEELTRTVAEALGRDREEGP